MNNKDPNETFKQYFKRGRDNDRAETRLAILVSLLAVLLFAYVLYKSLTMPFYIWG